MAKGLRVFSFMSSCRNRNWLLAVFWTFFFLFGLVFCSLTNPFFSPLMCRAIHVPVSIVGLVSVLFLPLFVSAIAAHFHSAVLIFLICSIRGFSFGCCLYSVFLVFDVGGWLIAWLLMFSSILYQIVLLWFWLRCLSDTICLHRDIIICAVVAVVIGSLDYFCVSPFLQMLIGKL